MNASVIFTLTSTAAGIAWLFLMGPARWMPRTFAVVRIAVPLSLAVAYMIVLASAWPWPGGFGSLEQVSLLFSSKRALLAGWIHYLAFDFLVGCWMLAIAKEAGLRHALLVPALLLTFLFGPAGYLVFQSGRLVSGRGPRDATQRSAEAL